MKKVASTTSLNFDFMGKFPIFGGLSVLALVSAFLLIPIKGIQYGIDFAGGTEMEILLGEKVELSNLRATIDGLGFKNGQVQSFGENSKEYLIRFENAEAPTESEANEKNKQNVLRVTEEIKKTYTLSGVAPNIRRVDSVGPQVGSQLKRNSVLAALYSLLIILVYVGMRFDYQYAPGAVLCLFHDSILTLGVIVLFGREVNIQVLAAILTLLGYSLNDTIVTFDRIRENENSKSGETITQLVNRSVNECLSRTIITTLLTFISVLALYIFARGAIRDFAFAMMWGMGFGVYSTIFVASPLVILYEKYILKRA